MAGYDENFLKVKVPMPTFSPGLKKSVLATPDLRNGIYADHITYTVVTDRKRRAPLFVAVNINQKLLKKKVGSRTWRPDDLFDKEFQLGPEYFDGNDYDKGHLAMREQAAWGSTFKTAQKAAYDTFFYSNAALQHANFNQDEWKAVEDWVTKLELDRDDKITCFAGPIYGSYSRTVTPKGLEPADVPASFFKVVVFIDRTTKKLAVRAFIVVHDEKAMKHKKGKDSIDRKMYDGQNYQTTITEIQNRTGLQFGDSIVNANPLYYKKSQVKKKGLTIRHFPERIDVDRGEEMITSYSDHRTFDAMDKIDVYVAAAMVAPVKTQSSRQWISIINLDKAVVDLSAWTVEVIPHYSVRSTGLWHQKTLGNGNKTSKMLLTPGQSFLVDLTSKTRLSDEGSTILLKDGQGRLIDRVKYTKDKVVPGKPVILFEL